MQSTQRPSGNQGCTLITAMLITGIVTMWVLLGTVWALPDAKAPFAPTEVSRALANLLFD